MKTLECEQCGDTITKDSDGLKYDDMYFCSQGCLLEHVNWDTYPIKPSDFEEDGEDEEEENDYDVQLGYAND